MNSEAEKYFIVLSGNFLPARVPRTIASPSAQTIPKVEPVKTPKKVRY